MIIWILPVLEMRQAITLLSLHFCAPMNLQERKAFMANPNTVAHGYCDLLGLHYGIEGHMSGASIALKLSGQSFDSIMETMLHELAHFVSHPHDGRFNAELARLKAAQAAIIAARGGFEGVPELIAGAWQQNSQLRERDWNGVGYLLGCVASAAAAGSVSSRGRSVEVDPERAQLDRARSKRAEEGRRTGGRRLAASRGPKVAAGQDAD
jgi:hypothetical protein